MSEVLTIRKEKQSQASRREVILRLLKEAGPAGRTNLELNEVCFRYGARLWELRKHHRIDTLREGPGIFRFVYRGLKQDQQELFPLTDMQVGLSTTRAAFVQNARNDASEQRD